MKSFLALIAFFISCVVCATEAENQLAERYIALCQFHTELDIAALEKADSHLSELETKLKREYRDKKTSTGKRITRGKIDEIKEERKTFRKRVNDLKNKKLYAKPFIYANEPERGFVGSIMYIGRIDFIYSVEVSSIVDKSTVMVYPDGETTEFHNPIFIKMTSEGLADGDKINIKDLIFAYNGTRKYTTIMGGANTVHEYNLINDIDLLVANLNLKKTEKINNELAALEANDLSDLDYHDPKRKKIRTLKRELTQLSRSPLPVDSMIPTLASDDKFSDIW